MSIAELLGRHNPVVLHSVSRARGQRAGMQRHGSERNEVIAIAGCKLRAPSSTSWTVQTVKVRAGLMHVFNSVLLFAD